MRVITGTARGTRLSTLEGTDVVRPTSDRVKEAMFSAINFEIEGSNILDLFSGSGQLGIEALSRGARHATFVDSSKKSVELTKSNIEKCHLETGSRVVNMGATDFLNGTKSEFDIALLDPPYNKGILEHVMPKLVGKMSETGIIVCEHERELKLAEKYGKFQLKKTYNYGKISLSLYRMKEE